MYIGKTVVIGEFVEADDVYGTWKIENTILILHKTARHYGRIKTCKSATLVPVAPVINKASAAFRA